MEEVAERNQKFAAGRANTAAKPLKTLSKRAQLMLVNAWCEWKDNMYSTSSGSVANTLPTTNQR